jgi:AhpD family alkylhydroperoxidase
MELWEFRHHAPAASAALSAVSPALATSGVGEDLLELVKLRASQMNGCTFCTQFHLNHLRGLNVAQDKLDLLVAWREASVFSARERAALEWAELLIDLPREGVSNAAYEAVSQHFSKGELAALTTAVGLINAWNRISVAFRFPPPAPQKPAH